MRLTAALTAISMTGALLAAGVAGSAQAAGDGTITIAPGAAAYVAGSQVTVKVHDPHGEDQGHFMTLQATDASGNPEPVLPLDLDTTSTCHYPSGVFNPDEVCINGEHTNVGGGQIDALGDAYFSVTLDQPDAAAGVVNLTAFVGARDAADATVQVVAGDLATETTLTKSVGRVDRDSAGPGGPTANNAKIVVHATEGGSPAAGVPVRLVASPENPHPPTSRPFGLAPFGFGAGFFAGAPDVRVSGPATTDEHGVATFTVTEGTPGADLLSYFTPVFTTVTDPATLAVARSTTAVIFGEAPPDEADKSSISLSDPHDGGLESEFTAPADGVTPTAVYVRLRCGCGPAEGYTATYKDAPLKGDGGLLLMPMPTRGDDSDSDLRGALTEVHAQSPGSHAVIRPFFEKTDLAASYDPLGPGQAYTASAGDPAENFGVAVFKITDSVAEDVTLSAFDATNNVAVAGDHATVTIHFLPSSPYLAHTKVSAAPAAVPADGTTPAHIHVRVRDAGGNPISGRTVQIVPPADSDVVLSATAATTDVNGRAQFDVSDSTVEQVSFNLFDQQTGFLGTTTVNFTAAPPSILNSSISVAPLSVPADGVSHATVTVNLADGAGNAEVGVPVTLTQGGANSTITADPSDAMSTGPDPVPVTDDAGRIRFRVTDASAEQVYYAASVQTTGIPFVLATTTPVTFEVGAVTTAESTLTADLASVPANGVSAATVTATLRDAHGNPVFGKTVTLSADSPQAVIHPVNGTVSSTKGTVAFSVTDTTPQQVTLTATDTSDGNLTVGPLTITFSGGVTPACPTAPHPESCSELEATPATAAVNSIVTVRAIARDTNGFPVSGQHLTLNTAGAAYQISQDPTGGITGGDGIVTFLVSSSAPGPVAYTVLNNATALGTVTVTFFGAPAGVHTTIAVNPGVVPADGSSTGTVTVTVHDINDNPVAAQPVSLVADSPHVTVAPTGPAPTDEHGVVSFAVADTTVERVTLKATAGALTTDPVALSFVAPHTEAGESTVRSSASGDVPADGSTAVTVTVTLKDGDGAALAGHDVALDCPPGVVTPVAGSTGDADGQVAFSVTASTAGAATCTATDRTTNVTLLQTPQWTFVTPPSEANQSTVTASPTVVPNDGLGAATIVVVLRAADGTPLTGHGVSLTADGGSPVIAPTSAITDSTGSATFTVTAHSAGTRTFTVTDTTASVVLEQQATVTFTDEAVASSAVAAPPAVPADGHSAASIIVTLISAGHPVSGHQVTLVPQNGVSHIRVLTQPTGQDGKAVFKVTDTVAEAVRYRVEDATLALTLVSQPLVTFTGAGPAPTVSSLTPVTGPAGTVVTITGHNLAGAAVNFGEVPAQTVTINAEGTVVHATAPGGSGSGTVAVTLATGHGQLTAGHFRYTGAAVATARHRSTRHRTAPGPHSTPSIEPRRPGKA
jgi:hypothetical protein